MSALLDALDYATGVLDKPGRAARGLLAGNTREGLAALPFSDALGWTDEAERVSGEDLLRRAGLATGNGAADWLLGQGAEVLLDPTNLVGAGAAVKGLKSLRGLGRAGETADEAIDALKFARRPGVESYARAPAGVVGRTRDLGHFADDLPLASQVAAPPGAPGYGDEWEFALRANRAAREGAGRFGGVPAGTLDDLPKFDDPPGRAAAPGLEPPPAADVPAFADWAWKLGDPFDPHLPSVVTDAVREGLPAADVQRVAAGAWGEALDRLAALPADAKAAVADDPRWRSALLARLAEVYGLSRHGSVLDAPDDVAAGLLRQYAQLHDVLGVRPVRTGGLAALAPPGVPVAPGVTYRLGQLANLGDLSDPAFAVADLAPGGLMDRHMRYYADQLPVLNPDMDAARGLAGRAEAAGAADFLREHGTALADTGRIDPDMMSVIRHVLTSRSREITPDAIRGALRLNPDLAPAYHDLLAALEREFTSVPELLLGPRRAAPVDPEMLAAAHRRLEGRGIDVFGIDPADLDPNAFH